MEFGSPQAAVRMGELCRARLVLGTVGYMSLEQARGQVSTDALTYSFWCDSLRDASRQTCVQEWFQRGNHH